MIKQAFQHAELRDANDNIIQQGAYGKKSDLANATNDAWIDHVMNNLEVLHDKQENDMATKEYVDEEVAGLVDSAPSTLDTLAELAAALGDDPNFATTIVNLIDAKCAQAKLDAHPVGSFYESTDPTSPAELFGGTWEEKIPDGELVGSIAYFAGQSSAPAGWILCNGATVSRTTYAVLFSAVGTTYGSGDGSTTFALPNLIDKFVEGSTTAGSVKNAGLPDITGSYYMRLLQNQYGNIMNTTGSYRDSMGIEYASNAGQATFSGATTKVQQVTFYASRSSSIYGSSTTVQPPALTMRPFIYTGKTSLNKWLRTA